MRKLKPSRQGGTEYVRLADLPNRQVGNLLGWLPPSCLTKVNEEEQILENCIEYEDYEFWYENFYQKDSLAAFEEEL
ncbi:hypothetical protein [Nafulsella turpanensis]|uniref:hypothetical protein n=1 Tax=Nafulsella turpanensis TaxID=1265690 RepID=UPI0003476C84|nr:hypothetical protein [Nafulsella turpanensis]